MTHPERERLHDYADGLLPPEEATSMEDHLSVCDACRRRVASIRALTDELASLPRGIRPERDLRPPAPRPLRPGDRSRWPRVAAALALFLAAATAALLLPDGSDGDRETTFGERTPVPADVVLAPYEDAARQLATELDARRDRMDAETAALVQRNLGVLDAAIRDLQSAREVASSDSVLTGLLENRHRTRLEFLRRTLALLSES